MKEKPILFNAEMVRAILAGKKTQTRRVVKKQPKDVDYPGKHLEHEWCFWQGECSDNGDLVTCPYGKPGDRLWVRETWCVHKNYDNIRPSELPELKYLQNGVTYMADVYNGEKSLWMGRTRSPYHLPYRFSRIKPPIKNVRVERVQEISEEDAVAEGVFCNGRCWQNGDGRPYSSSIDAFHSLWDSINAKRGYGWEENPWVWVIEFEKI